MTWNHNTSSQGSSEASVLQKLAFDENGGNDLVFAKCVNRVRNNASALLPFLVEICMYFQALGLAFLTNYDSMFQKVTYLTALGKLFQVFVDWGSLVAESQQDTFNIALTIVLMVLVWPRKNLQYLSVLMELGMYQKIQIIDVIISVKNKIY